MDVCSIRVFQWLVACRYCCMYMFVKSSCNGFIATACADDCIRVFREVSIVCLYTMYISMVPLIMRHFGKTVYNN